QATNRVRAFIGQRKPTPTQNGSWPGIVAGAQTQTLLSDEPALRTVMIGKQDARSQPEVVWVVTRLYFKTLFYMVFVAPEDEFPIYQPIFEEMIGSVRLR